VRKQARFCFVLSAICRTFAARLRKQTEQGTMERIPPLIQVENVLLATDILTESFCCDLDRCKGQCCVEGDAGAPVTPDEVLEIETAWPQAERLLADKAKAVIAAQGVAYTDAEGDLVTSIVDGRDCVFTWHEGGCCLCALEKVYRQGKTRWPKPVSCALYPIRAKAFANGTVGLTYNRWSVCRPAVEKGRQLGLPLYRFLETPLVRRFGRPWYRELCQVARQLIEH